jgi:NADH:ubiquinone reductase (H+-translocating)
VFVVGDLMALEHHGQPFSPGLAPVAIQQGAYVGKRIAQQVAGQEVSGPFVYCNKGNLATVGRAFAIADLGWIRFSGLPGWLLWCGVHLVYLTKMWNRVQVFATWIWSYLTYDRAVRVLTPDSFQSDIQVVPHADVRAVGAGGAPPPGDGVQPSDQQQQLARAADVPPQ